MDTNGGEMSEGKGIKRLKRMAKTHLKAHAQVEDWMRSTSDRLARMSGDFGRIFDRLAKVEAKDVARDAGMGDLRTEFSERASEAFGGIPDRLRAIEAKDAEHAATVATIVDGLERLERRVSKKGRGKANLVRYQTCRNCRGVFSSDDELAKHNPCHGPTGKEGYPFEVALAAMRRTRGSGGIGQGIPTWNPYGWTGTACCVIN